MSRGRRLVVFGLFAIVFVSLMPGFFDHATERFDKLDYEMSDESARTRGTIWMYTERVIADHPLAGIGFGEQQFVNVIMNDYHFADDFNEQSLDNPHNSYLQMTVYAGFPALLAFLLANGLLLLRGWRCIRRRLVEGRSHVLFGLAVGIAGFLAVIYPDMHMFTQNVAPVYWIFFALLLSATTKMETARPALQQAYENSRSYVRNTRQRVAGQPTAFAPRRGWNRDRASAAGVDVRRQSGAASQPDPALRRDPQRTTSCCTTRSDRAFWRDPIRTRPRRAFSPATRRSSIPVRCQRSWSEASMTPHAGTSSRRCHRICSASAGRRS